MTEATATTEPKKEKLIRLEGEMLIISKSLSIDPNKDGEPLLEFTGELKIHLSELPDEAYDMWKKRKK